MDLPSFVAKWKASGASERANKDSFLRDLCDVLGVPHPDAKSGDPDHDRYVFEREATLLHGGERTTVGFIDLYKQGCFVLEAKQGSHSGSSRVGTARRDTPAWNVAMQEAFGQALTYTSTIESPPPFLIITDIGYCFDLYAAFDGTRNYRKFPDALGARISIDALEREPRHLETLRAIFTDPHSLDPAKRSVKVTREIAMHLANVARSLDDAGHDPVRVAQFLMRCLFTMFVEDIGLLQQPVFTTALKEHWLENPDSFPGEVESLWRTMNEGGHLFGAGRVWKFNGGLFADPTALPLTKQQLGVLALAATADWKDVEPAIFGTLLERALDPKERHRLGAHYTPRAYVERLVRPTIEEPLRAEWDIVRAQVVRLVNSEPPDNIKNKKVVAEARKIVHAFYDRLTQIRVLDPACGSGNFLYVALDLFKRIENEVIDLLDNLGGDRSIVTFGRMVSPQQFLGIEIKEWAKEITELVLWIGWLQWQIRTRGYKNHPEEPILRDYHNIERRDAVLAYDDKVPLLDDQGKEVTRWDGETMKRHPVTGEEVPDDTARVPVYRYVNPRKAEWPEAEFVVGNPPFIGASRLREALGDGYVQSLRAAHGDVPESADLVMFWWNHAANLVRAKKIQNAGLITTKGISQSFNRRIVAQHLTAEQNAVITFAIPNHPWSDSNGSAQVRIAMTTISTGTEVGRLCIVVSERMQSDQEPLVELECTMGVITPQLTIGADITKIQGLRASNALAAEGVKPHGLGFVVTSTEARHLGLDRRSDVSSVIRPYANGRDIAARPRNVLIIDLHGLDEDEVKNRFPEIYQHLLMRVKPERDLNREQSRRQFWWLFGRRNTELRAAVAGLQRYIATVKTAKFRVFTFVEGNVVPDSKLIVVAVEDGFALGCLSSAIHVLWATHTGSRLGVGDDPTYVKSRSFDCFPFPDPDEFTRQRIRNLGEQLDAHRKRQQELHPELTITGMYNVLKKLRSGEALAAKEKKIHEEGLVSVLRQIHDELDAAVFDAYGWPHALSDEEILERLVALNAVRAEEERKGLVRWLRPEFQNPDGAASPSQTPIGLELEQQPASPATAKASPDLPPWPKDLRDQVSAVRDLLTTTPQPRPSWSAEEVARSFKSPRKPDLTSVLEALAALGLLLAFDTPQGRRWRAV